MFTLATVETYMNEETPEAANILGYETLDAALVDLHYKMWAAMSSENIKSVRMTIQDPYGNVKRFEDWQRPVQPEFEPDVEPEIEPEVE